jgi:hypothetical protein
MVDIDERHSEQRRDTLASGLHGRLPVLIALGASALSGAISGALVTAVIARFLCQG